MYHLKLIAKIYTTTLQHTNPYKNEHYIIQIIIEINSLFNEWTAKSKSIFIKK